MFCLFVCLILKRWGTSSLRSDSRTKKSRQHFNILHKKVSAVAHKTRDQRTVYTGKDVIETTTTDMDEFWMFRQVRFDGHRPRWGAYQSEMTSAIAQVVVMEFRVFTISKIINLFSWSRNMCSTCIFTCTCGIRRKEPLCNNKLSVVTSRFAAAQLFPS